MYVANTLRINAPARRIYDLAAPVERWPALLPHYRWVKVLERRGHTALVEMACWRDVIPLRWTSLVELVPDVPRIRFLHIGGVTGGMAVTWEFCPVPGGTEVRIEHTLRLRWPLVGAPVADHLIGPFIVANVADKTLARMKVLAESADGR